MKWWREQAAVPGNCFVYVIPYKLLLVADVVFHSIC